MPKIIFPSGGAGGGGTSLTIQEEGVDVEGQLTCIQEAACDEFAVIECENEYGVESDND